MKRYSVLFILLVSVVMLSNNILVYSQKDDICAKIYYVDNTLINLMSYEYNTECKTNINAVNKVISKIIGEKSEITNSISIIAPHKKSASAKIINNTCIIDLKSDLIDDLPKSRDYQLLFIYQLINSVTSIKGIDKVQFTVDGKTKKMLIGGVDIRETFIPDYSI